jgi:hypothetical protein
MRFIEDLPLMNSSNHLALIAPTANTPISPKSGETKAFFISVLVTDGACESKPAFAEQCCR